MIQHLRDAWKRINKWIALRESRRTFMRDGCTYTEITYHEGLLGEVKVDERLIAQLKPAGRFNTIGPVRILGGMFLLHLDFDVCCLQHRCWPLNPLTAVSFPFWCAWTNLERKVILRLLLRARKRGIIVLPEYTYEIGNLYLYYLRHLWFTKRAQTAKLHNRIAEDWRRSWESQERLFEAGLEMLKESKQERNVATRRD